MQKWKLIVGTTMAVSAIVVFLIVGIKAIQVSIADNDRSLEMVHIVMRHGARTPVSTYPNDPYKYDPLHPVGWGQLTNEGKLSLYKIGQYFRERYGTFLGEKFSPDLYYTQSTDVDRTKASMQLVNAGLWPPKGEQVWGPLDWQPIPIHSEPLDQDMLLLVRKPCPKYHILKKEVMESEEVQNMFEEYKDLFEKLAAITGARVNNFEDVQDIYTTLQAEEAFNLTLPKWTKEYYPEKMYIPTVRSFVLNTYTDKINRLLGGVLVKKLIGDWSAKAQGKQSMKAFLYGGHDSTIVNLLRTLKIWDEQLPNYTITVMLELYKDQNTNDYGVEIYLRNSTSVPPFKLTIPGCDSFCPLNKLKQLTAKVIPENWEEECQIDDKSFIVPELNGP